MTGEVDRTIVWLTWRQLFARRRLYLAGAFSLAPAAVTLLFRAFVDSSGTSSADFLVGLTRELTVGTLLPLTAVVFGTTAFGGEVDDGTLINLLVKPLARWRVVLWKYVVAVLSTAAVMLPAIVLPWLMLRSADVPAAIPVSFLVGAATGSVLYCAIFVALGLMTRRALVAGLLYIVAIELVLSRNVPGARSLSIREFAIATSQATSGSAVRIAPSPVTLSTVWWMGGIMFASAMVVAVRRLGGYEVAERL